MEMGKHIIVFITAILMPFMAYGADSATSDTCCEVVAEVAEDKKESACNKKAGCEWSGYDTCDPCGAGYFNAGGGDGSIGCTQCDNAPKDCGTDDSTCNWIQDEAYTGQISNTCPWEMDVTMTINEHSNIPATLSNLNDGNTTDNEKKLVIKIDDPEKKFSTISDSFNNNQIVPFVIQLNEDIKCTINSMEHNGYQWKLVCNYDQSLSEPQISSQLSLTVTAKEFQYVFVPMNSVEYDNYITIGIDKNTSDVETGTKFGETVTVSSDTEYKQYNNCTYDKTNHTVNCSTNPITLEKPTNGFLTLDYNFKYIDKDTEGNPTIIVLERATGCQAGQYCPTYTTTGDTDCPNIFWSDKNATSITDCYLDNKVKFFDNNNRNGVQLIPQGTKVYHQGNPTQ